MSDFSATAAAGEDSAVVVTARGELDLLSASELIAVLRDAIVRYRPSRVELDLTEVPFIDSTGIQVLVAANTDITGGLRIIGTSPAVHRLLQLTGLLQTFGITG